MLHILASGVRLASGGCGVQQADRSRGGMFHGMKAVTVMPDERKRGVYRLVDGS